MTEEGCFLPFTTSDLPPGPWLVFAPHADDETFGMGGAMALASRAGMAVHLVVLTDGAKGGLEGDDALVQTRVSEARAAADCLGLAGVRFWQEPDRGLKDVERLRRRVAESVAELQPASVFFPSPMEPHPDHRACAHLVWDGMQASGQRSQAWSYEVTVQGQINCLIDVTPVMDLKRKAMDCYRSQLGENRYADLVTALNRTRAFSLGPAITYAEGFYGFGLPAGALEAQVVAQLRAYWVVEPEQRPSLVSVVIRTKDRPVVLRRALASLAAQSHQEIEAVVVNDGTQAVDDVCAEFRPTLSAVRLLATPPPGGRVRAANAGLEAASGRYVIFLDDDDWFYPDHVQKLARALDADPDARVAYTGVECLRPDASGDMVKVHEFNQVFERSFLMLRNFIPMHAAMFDRAFVDDGVRLDEALDLYEDWDLWMQLAGRTGFRYVPGVSACYCVGSENGFGVGEEDDRQRAALDRFLKKWRHLWTPQDLREIVAYGRRVPELRQRLHDFHVACQEGEERQRQADREHRAREESLTSLNNRLQDSLEEERTLRQRLGERLGAQLHQAQQASQALELRYGELQRRYEEVLASGSWRVTAPYRTLMGGLRKELRRVRRLREDNRLRLANAREIVQAKGIGAYLSYARGRVSARGHAPANGAAADFPARQSVPELFEIPAGDYHAAAAALALPAAGSPRVSVIVPAFNHIGHTLACLRSVAAHPPRTPAEIILVDDASSDQTREILSAVAGLRYLRNDRNLGFVHTCNHGAAQARGDYLLFLNNDTQVMPGWLDALAETLDTVEDAGIVGAKLIYPSGHLQEAGADLHQDGSVTLVGLNGDPRDPRYDYLREVDHCSGAALMIRRSLFAELGGFDSRYAPAYFEDCDLSLRVRERGLRVYYQPQSQVLHHLSVTTDGMSEGKMAQIERNRTVYLERWGARLRQEDRVRLIAFYLPQYHPIPENDEWWGKGFTEWTNVTKAKPNFTDHYQPHQPSDLGYYDLRVAEVREQQARLARRYGVYGFCYYYYWFDGKRLLDRPLAEVLESGEPDFPFCICWANENWTRRWDGRDSEVLIAQNYNEASNRHFIRDLLPYLRDRRYIRIDGRPLLLVYRPAQIPDLAGTVHLWRQVARESGIGELYLAAVESFSGADIDVGKAFDACVEFPPHGRAAAAAAMPELLNPEFAGNLYDYPVTAENFMHRTTGVKRLFRSAMPNWDNTARRQNTGDIFLGATPEAYGRWLRHIVQETRSARMGEERIVFVNAWNEWAEGNHLEPDRKYGHAYLEATREALGHLGCYDQPERPHPIRAAGGDA